MPIRKMFQRRVAMAKDDENAVAEFIRSKGVTRCPTAFISPTQATVAHSDRNDLRRHAEVRELARRARSPKNRHAAWLGKNSSDRPDASLTEAAGGPRVAKVDGSPR